MFFSRRYFAEVQSVPRKIDRLPSSPDGVESWIFLLIAICVSFDSFYFETIRINLMAINMIVVPIVNAEFSVWRQPEHPFIIRVCYDIFPNLPIRKLSAVNLISIEPPRPNPCLALSGIGVPISIPITGFSLKPSRFIWVALRPSPIDHSLCGRQSPSSKYRLVR